MRFCVLAKISKRSMSLWYQAEEKSYAPLLVKGAADVPLFFYVNGNDFLFGNAARDRFLANDPKAFGNFFEIIKDPAAHFSIYGNKKPVKQLFYYGLEQCLSNFINTVLYKNDSIESYRPGFPLRFLFGPDLEDKEKILIESLFTEAGYNNVTSVNYTGFLFQVLFDKKLIADKQPLLLLNGIAGTLYLQLYKAGEITGFLKLAGQGADPRVKILAQMIVEYIQTDKSYLMLDMEKEVATVLPFAASLLNNMPPVLSGEVPLSDGNLYYYNVRKRRLTEQLLYDSNEHIIYAAINDLLEQNNMSVTEVCILLGSEEVSTDFFSERLAKVYPNVKAISSYDANEAMRILFMDIRAKDYVFQKKNISPDLPLTSRAQIPEIPKKTIEPPHLPRVPIPPPMPSAALKSNGIMPPLLGNIAGLSSLITKTGIVIIKISPVGKVCIEQKEYEAKSTATELPIGTTVKVTGIEGKKYLLVERSGSPPLPFQKKTLITR